MLWCSQKSQVGSDGIFKARRKPTPLYVHDPPASSYDGWVSGSGLGRCHRGHNEDQNPSKSASKTPEASSIGVMHSNEEWKRAEAVTSCFEARRDNDVGC